MSLDQAETEKLAEQIELARSFIAREHADPAQEVRGDWISPEARPAHDALCLCLDVLRRPAPRPSDAGVREIAKDAIRTFCKSLGAHTCVISSDGVERIYHAGISLDALAVAVDLALRTAPVPTAAGEPVAKVTQCDDGRWMIHNDGDVFAFADEHDAKQKALKIAAALNALPNSAADVRAKVVEETTIRAAFDEWAWKKAGSPVGVMLPHEAARAAFHAGVAFALSPDAGTKAGGERQG